MINHSQKIHTDIAFNFTVATDPTIHPVISFFLISSLVKFFPICVIIFYLCFCMVICTSLWWKNIIFDVQLCTRDDKKAILNLKSTKQ